MLEVKNNQEIIEKDEKETDNFEHLENSFSEAFDSVERIEEGEIAKSSQIENSGLEKILSGISSASSKLVRGISSEVAKIYDSNKITVTFRDLYLKKTADKLISKINRQNVNPTFQSIEGHAKLSVEINNLFKTVKSGFWGTSKYTEDAEYKLAKLLEMINETQEKATIMKPSEISALYPEIYNNQGLNKSWSADSWKAFLDNQGNKFIKDNAWIESDTHNAKIEEESGGDSFLVLEFLKKTAESHRKADVDPGMILKAIDDIVEKYPRLDDIPSDLFTYLMQTFNSFPEELLNNETRRTFMFDIWLKNINDGCNIEYALFFLENLKNASEKERKVLENKLKNNFASNEFSLSCFFAMTPLGKNNPEFIKEANKENHIDSNREFLINQPFRLLHPELFIPGKYQESKESLLRSVSSLGRQNGNSRTTFIMMLADNFSHLAKNIDEEEIITMIDKLFDYNSVDQNLNQLHLMAAFLEGKEVPEFFKKRIYHHIDIDVNELQKIFVDEKEDEKNSWVYSNPDLLISLQSEYFVKCQENELRHYFYEAIEGNHEVGNFDKLVEAYANRGDVLDANEIVVLFISPGKIDRKYLTIFINRIPDYKFTDIRSKLHNLVESGEIDKEDYLWVFKTMASECNFKLADMAMGRILSEEQLSEEDRVTLIANYTNNAISQYKETKKREEYQGWLILGPTLEKMTEVERSGYARKFFFSLLDDEADDYKRASFVFNNYNLEYLKVAWPNKKDQANYLKSVIDKTEEYGSLNQLAREYFNQNETYEILDEKYRKELEARVYGTQDGTVCCTLIGLINRMTDEQKKAYLEKLKAKEDIFEGLQYDNGVVKICQKINGSCYEASLTEIETIRQIYSKILDSNLLDGSALEKLFDKEILIRYPDLLKKHVEQFLRLKCGDGYHMLDTLSTEGRSTIDHEDIKQISRQTMESGNLTRNFYQRALIADKENPDFYLDQELFNIGIVNFKKEPGLNNLGQPELALSFFDELKNGPYSLNVAQEKILLSQFLIVFNSSKSLELCYKYNQDIFEELVVESLKGESNSDFFLALMNSNIIFSENLSSEAIGCFKKQHINNKKLFWNLCDHFKGVQQFEGQIKEIAYNQKEENKTEFKMILFDHDYLSAVELKNFYNDSVRNGEGSVRQHVLQSADILGSLAGRGKVDDLSKFLDKPNAEVERRLQSIAEFTSKYSIEDKGRTIVVMLFAKEYLPELSLEEVITKVAGRLNKYEKILEKYSYKNIPEGLQASIGMEYEVTSSTAAGYKEITGQDFKTDILRLSKAARVGAGRDAVHEIATRPALNPYLMLLEMNILDETDFVDLNFDRSPDYQKGARGFHLTIGGENGLKVDDSTNFLQNAIIAASWGGVQAGQLGVKANKGRGVSLRDRGIDYDNNVKLFEEKTPAVELRSLSMDKMETLQRAVTTAYHGAIAIQAMNKHCSIKSSDIGLAFNISSNKAEFFKLLTLKSPDKIDNVSSEIIYNWAETVAEIEKASEHHNESFLSDETVGYLDENNIWVDSKEFGGEYNKNRFESVVKSMDPTLSVEEYVNSTKIGRQELFFGFNEDLSDKLTKINNLFLKSGSASNVLEGEKMVKEQVFKGDGINALAMLQFTKFDNENLEYRSDKEFLESTVFDTSGDKREGYYSVQGGSEKMLTHAVQLALLKFNHKMEALLN
ncbi:MAG: hypothetical protein ACOYMB_04495 [Patescibacteria group bacterium]